MNVNLFSREGNLTFHQIFFYFLFLVALGLCCCALLSLAAVPRLLTEVASRCRAWAVVVQASVVVVNGLTS